MANESREQASSTNETSQELQELVRSLAKESNLSEEQTRVALLASIPLLGKILPAWAQVPEFVKYLYSPEMALVHGIGQREKELKDKNQSILRIAILEEPLTAQNLSTILAAITDLHARCWFIQQKRLTDLMDYAQTRDPRFLKEASLQIGILSHNSPAIIDFIVNAGSIAGGGATLVFALKKGIDAVVQTPLRFEEAKLKNEREKLNQQIATQKAEAEKKSIEQEQQLTAQKAQLELEKQQLEIDRQRLELQRDRIKIILEVATTLVSQLQSDTDAGQREMIIHSLVPPFLQIAATDSLITAIIPEPTSEANKETS